MKIWIVVEGQMFDGYSIRGVYADDVKALDLANSLMQEFEEDLDTFWDYESYGTSRTWTNADDKYVQIQEWEVK